MNFLSDMKDVCDGSIAACHAPITWVFDLVLRVLVPASQAIGAVGKKKCALAPKREELLMSPRPIALDGGGFDGSNLQIPTSGST